MTFWEEDDRAGPQLIREFYSNFSRPAMAGHPSEASFADALRLRARIKLNTV